MLAFTPPFRFSATLEAHESDVRSVVAPYSDLIVTASRDETVCSWTRAGPAEKEFRLSSVGLGHHAYVNSVAFVYPHGDNPNGLIASGGLSGLIQIHEAPSRGSWASSVDGEAGATPGTEHQRPSEQPIQTLIGHSHNVCSLSTSTPSWAVTPLSLARKPQPPLLSTSVLPAPMSHSSPTSGTSSPVLRRGTGRPLSLSIPSLPTFGTAAESSPVGQTPTQDSSLKADSPSTSSPRRGKKGGRPSSSTSQHSVTFAPRFPPAGASELAPVLISTSWDCTARVWSLETFETLVVLEGHKEAVWAGIVVESWECGRGEKGGRTYLTASADRTIIHWDENGVPIRNFKGSTDVVRSLTLLPNNEFASTSNDGSIRVWSFDGELRGVLTGHRSFVYDLCVLPNGDLASAGEDSSVRIWSNGKQIQMILHPAISVWSVTALPNGDIVTGSSDHTGRVFTRDAGRVADFELLTAYEEAVTEAVKSPPAVVDAHAGPSYFKLSVDVADDRPPLELNFDTKETPKRAAERFVGENELPESYVDQIEGFLKAHLPVPSPAPTPAFEMTGFPGITGPAPYVPPPTMPSLEAKLAEQLQREHAAAASHSEDEGTGAFEDESERTLEGVAELIRTGRAKKIVILSGAGISTNAGIPDFRSPETGLYANLEKYDLPHPEAVFDIDYFKLNPKPFYELAKELYPGKFLPTITHFLFFLLQQRGLLQRVFTQNIDTLERVAGVRDSLIVEAHGSFASARCIVCKKLVNEQWVKDQVDQGAVPLCPSSLCKGRKGALVKPDIVFFGESLPDKFFAHLTDLASCDLLLVFGTSLKVHPFASLIDRVGPDVPRVLINQEVVGEAPYEGARKGFHFDLSVDEGGRDVMYKGDSDSASRILARGLRLESELDAIVKEKQADLRERWNLPSSGPSPASTTVDNLTAQLAKDL